MRRRVEHGHVVGARLEHRVHRPVRVDRGIAAIGRDEVVQVRLRVRPVPHGDDDVPLDALRARRRGRNRARRDPVGPVREHLQRARPHHVRRAEHAAAGLTRRQPPLPCLRRRRERAERGMQLARPFAAHLVATEARAVLHEPEVVLLALEGRVDAVPVRARAGKLARGRYFDQREPVTGRVVLGRGARIRRGRRLQAQRRPGPGALLRRIDQAVAAHPDVVRRLRQVGDEVASPVVGDDDARELRRQVGRLGDDPHARLGSVRSRHDARDVVRIDRRRFGDARRAVRPGHPEHHGKHDRRDRDECPRRLHSRLR